LIFALGLANPKDSPDGFLMGRHFLSVDSLRHPMLNSSPCITTFCQQNYKEIVVKVVLIHDTESWLKKKSTDRIPKHNKI